MRPPALWSLAAVLSSLPVLAAPTSESAPRAAPAVSPSAATAAPISFIADTKESCLLGAVRSGQYLDAVTARKSAKAPLTFQLFDATGPKGTALGITAEGGEPCTDVPRVEWGKVPEGVEAVALSASHPPLPRQATPFGAQSASYEKAAAELLASKGVRVKKPKLVQGFRVDLEGDGKEETLVVANNVDIHSVQLDGPPARNVYSFVFLRRVIGEKVENLLLSGDIKATSNGPPTAFSVAGIVDVDGDGTLEIAVRWAYYEGSGVELFRLREGKWEKALSCGCGA